VTPWSCTMTAKNGPGSIPVLGVVCGCMDRRRRRSSGLRRRTQDSASAQGTWSTEEIPGDPRYSYALWASTRSSMRWVNRV
jgi:hypothetical protein